MGLDARWARDWTDHVWTEVWSPHLGRWVHADPGEERYDTPLLYEGGWGKKLTYVIAFDAGGVTDVTRRYTARWGETLARRGAVPEAWLAAEVGAAGGRLRAALPPSERILRERRDLEEEDELRAGPAGGGGGGALPGRLTGSLEWRSGRGELGGARGDNAPPAEAGAPAFDDDVAASVPGRAVGGWVTASGENAPHESAVRAFDGRNDTKWLDFGAAGGREAWISYRLSPETKSKAVVSYSMTSGDDEPGRDPRSTVLEGSRDGGATWHAIDTREGLEFPSRLHRLSFPVATPGAYSHIRLRILGVRDPAGASCVQLSRLDIILGTSAAPEAGGEWDEATRSVVVRLLTNLANNPESETYRRIKMSNPRIRSTVGAHPAAMEMLRGAGFALTQEGGEDVLLASSPDPAKLRDASAQLLTTPPPPKGGRGLPVASAAPSGGEGTPATRGTPPSKEEFQRLVQEEFARVTEQRGREISPSEAGAEALRAVMASLGMGGGSL
mmetsp:Transcript_38608/g.122661  ORF Transcript_38608/g.122661 Transcript_38608/m.122661 type:complete len:500 (+) Transcript_38608:529-2028(+)